MVALGAHFSAIWIVVANSWMQTPAGFHIVGEGIAARAEIINFWEMLFNPSSMTRLGHVIIGCWLAGGFMLISVGAFYILKKRHIDFAKCSIKIGLCITLTSTILQVFSGDSSGKIVAKYQPLKLAAIEGLYKTKSGAPLTLIGLVKPGENKIHYAVQIPKLLSFLSFGNFSAEIKGLDQFPREDWPNVMVIFQVYRLMIGSWVVMFLLSVFGVLMLWRGTLYKSRLILGLMTISEFFPQLGNQAGWVTAEMGRYPWIVYNNLRISEGLSKVVTANQVLGSIIMFTIIYVLLFILFIYLLNDKIKHGPVDLVEHTPYQGLKLYVEEINPIINSSKDE